MSATKEKFVLQNKFKDFVPGIPMETYISRSAGLFGTVVMVLLIGGCGLVSGFAAVSGFREDDLFANYSDITTGQIISCQIQPAIDSKHQPYPMYAYTYQVNNMEYVRHFSSGDASCEAHSAGAMIQVRYLVSDPSSARVDDFEPSKSSTYALYLVVSLATIYYLRIIISGQYYASKRHALELEVLQNGRLLEGKIVAIRGYEYIQIFFVGVIYQFTSPKHEVIMAEIREPRPDLKDIPLPAVGTPVWVLYSRDDAHMML